jgi:membrane associated rhomboid family serine protease
MSARLARWLVIGLGCVVAGLSFVKRSRVWLHTRGSLHLWDHMVLFGVLGALAVRASRRMSRRLMWVAGAILLGLAMEFLQARMSQVAIEWRDVQTDCFGVGMGCLAVWLLPGKRSDVP